MIPTLPPLPGSVAAGRRPSWATAGLAHRPCPVCGEDAPRPMCVRPDGLVVARCACCAMVYVPDVPDAAAVASFYRDYSEHRAPDRARLSAARARWAARHDVHIAILAASGGLRGRSLVEIGCSFGTFLQLARAMGASVRGVELDEQAAAHLASLGIPSSREIARDVRTDIVCGFQLMEHLAAPASVVAAAADALVVDGRLLLSLPNGAEAERVGEGWIGFRVDLEHFNYFSVGALSRLLMPHGLCVEQFWEHRQPVIPRDEPGRAAAGLAGRILAAPRRALGRAVAETGHGTFVLTVLARKVKQ